MFISLYFCSQSLHHRYFLLLFSNFITFLSLPNTKNWFVFAGVLLLKCMGSILPIVAVSPPLFHKAYNLHRRVLRHEASSTSFLMQETKVVFAIILSSLVTCILQLTLLSFFFWGYNRQYYFYHQVTEAEKLVTIVYILISTLISLVAFAAAQILFKRWYKVNTMLVGMQDLQRGLPLYVIYTLMVFIFSTFAGIAHGDLIYFLKPELYPKLERPIHH